MNQSSAPRKLPDKLRILVNEIEAKAGCAICWEQDENLEGECWSNVEKGQPIIKYRKFTEHGAAHELLHLKLGLSGIPKCYYLGNLNLEFSAMSMLENVVHHLVIFPQLRQLGYDADERGSIRKQLNQVRQKKFDRIADEPDLKAMFSMFYARAQMDTKDLDLQAKVQRVFADERLQLCRALGEKVIEVIRSRDLSKNQEAYAVLEEAIGVLGLSDTITIEYP